MSLKGILTKLYDYLSEVVGMSCPDKKSHIAHSAFVRGIASELIFLVIGPCLHEEPDSEQYHPSDVSSRTKVGLIKPSNVRRIQDGYGKRNSPDLR